MFDEVKYNWHRDNHTLRYKNPNKTTNYVLDCDRKLKKDEIPITNIDNLFDNSFINCHTNSGYYQYNNFQSRPLNKKYQWKLYKLLHKESNKITEKWDPDNGVICKIFNIPIQKYILINNNLNDISWLKWNNKFYDPNYIYIFNGNDDDTEGTLKKYCNLQWNEPQIDNLKMFCKKVFIEKKKKKKLINSNENCYYEIDFGKFVNILNIATFGKYPNKRIFPKRKSNYNYYYYDTNKPYIYILDNIYNDSYVKKYSVYYKDSLTHKWIYYKDFDANTNSYTVKINSVDIYTRFIRIKPIDYVISKSMIIYFYDSNIKLNKNSDSDSDDEEILKYTLTPPNNNNYRHDGYGYYRYSPDWYYGQYYKTERKNKIKELLDEELNDI